MISSLDDELGDLVDTDHLAVAGHSSGAIVAFGLGFDPCCEDDRVDAVLVEGIIPFPLDGDSAPDPNGTPVLFVYGDADRTPIADAHALFEQAAPPKYFLTIPGGDHSEIYRAGEPAPLIANAALAFFDLYLRDRSDALATLQGVAGMEAVPE